MIQQIKIVFTFILVLVFATNAYSTLEFLYPAVKEMYWYMLLFALSIFFIIIETEKSVSNIPKRVVLWLSLYIISLIFAYSLSSQSDVVNRAAIIQIKSLAVFLGFFILITDKSIQKAALYGLVMTILIGSGTNVLEYFSDSVTWSETPGRSAGLYFNPNYSGFMLTFSLIFASLVVDQKWIWPLFIVTAAGTILTFSRTSWAFLFIIIVGISMIRASGTKQSLNPLDMRIGSFLTLFFSGLIGVAFIIAVTSGAALEFVKMSEFSHLLSGDAMSRLSGETSDGSVSERGQLFFAALKVGADNPIIGAGFGYTYEWSERVAPHNEWLMMFAERGIIGFIIYALFYVFIWIKSGRYAKLFVMIFGLSALSSHNGLELPATYLFTALAYLIKDEDYLHLNK